MIIRDLNNLAWQRDAQDHDVKDVWPGCQLVLVSFPTRIEPARDTWLLVLRGEGEMRWGHALLPLLGGVLVRVGAGRGLELTPRPDDELVVMLQPADRDRDRPRDETSAQPSAPPVPGWADDPAPMRAESLQPALDDTEVTAGPDPAVSDAGADANPDPLSEPPVRLAPPSTAAPPPAPATPAPPLRWTLPPG